MTPGMAAFWDARARENALFFVDDRLRYDDPDTDAFWAGGPVALSKVLELLEAPALEADATALEIGCGVGRVTRPLAERCARVYAIDVSERMLRLAREKNSHLSNVEWILGDGKSLAGVPDESVDVCYSFVVFQHIPDPSITLGYVREMGRVLRSGGWSAFHISNDPSVHRPEPRKRANPLRRGPSAPASGVRRAPEWLGSAVELDALANEAAAAGLEIDRVSGEGTQFCLVLLSRR